MSKSPVSIVFDPALAPLLPSLSEKPDHPLFPFSGTGESAEAHRKKLVQSGFIDEKGGLRPDARRLLGNLTGSRHTARLRVMTDGDVMEYQVFFSGGSLDQTTTLRPDRNQLRLESPARVEDMLEVLEDLLGASGLATSPTLGELSRTEALVLAAAIDLTRRELLTGLGQDTPWRPQPITAEKLEEVLGRTTLNSSWLLWLVQNLDSTGEAVPLLAIEEALESLAGRNLLEDRDAGYVLNREALVLSARFLQLSTLVRVDVACLSAGQTLRSSFGAVQGGVRDLMMIEPAGEKCHWAGLSAETLIGLVKRFLTAPVEMRVSGSSSGNGCAACGKAIEPGVAFCKFCGAPQKPPPEAKARFCSKCGAQLKGGKKFCPQCGVPAR